MCKHPLHLTLTDRRFLRSLRIESWKCPKCEPPKPQLRIEGAK